MGIISFCAIAVFLIATIYFAFALCSDMLDGKEKFVRFLIVLAIMLVAVGAIYAFDTTHEEELCEKTEMYSLPLVGINQKVSSGYTIPDNVYVLENSNGEYIFYTTYHTNEHTKRTVDKDNVVITTNDSLKPFAKVYKETYNGKNLIGGVIETYTIEKYYLVIPNGGIISDSILGVL